MIVHTDDWSRRFGGACLMALASMSSDCAQLSRTATAHATAPGSRAGTFSVTVACG